MFNATSNCSLPQRDLCSNTAHLVYVVLIGSSTLMVNILVVVVTCLIWTQNSSPDMILIFNMSASSLVMLVALPLHHFTITNVDQYLSCDSSIYHIYRLKYAVHYGANFATLLTLVAIGYDRLEALTKFPGQRKLTVSRACMVVASAWGVAVILAAFLFYWPLELQCDRFCFKPDLTLVSEGSDDAASSLPRIIIISVVIALCAGLTVTSLLRATWVVRAHRQQIEAMYGVVRAQAEVDFTKVCCGIGLTYVMTWLPSGITIIARSLSPSATILCINLWANSLAFSSALLITLIYIRLDKRLWAVIKARVHTAPTIEEEGSSTHSRETGQTTEINASHSRETGQTTENNASHSREPGQTTEINAPHSRETGQTTEINASHSRETGQTTEINASHSREPGQTTEINASHSREPGQTTENNASHSREPGQTTEINASHSRETGQTTEINASHSRETGQTTEINALHSREPGQTTETNALRSGEPGQTTETNASHSRETGQTTEINALHSGEPGQTTEINASHSRKTGQTTEINALHSGEPGQTTEINASHSRETGQTTEINALHSGEPGQTTEINAETSF